MFLLIIRSMLDSANILNQLNIKLVEKSRSRKKDNHKAAAVNTVALPEFNPSHKRPRKVSLALSAPKAPQTARACLPPGRRRN